MNNEFQGTIFGRELVQAIQDRRVGLVTYERSPHVGEALRAMAHAGLIRLTKAEAGYAINRLP